MSRILAVTALLAVVVPNGYLQAERRPVEYCFNEWIPYTHQAGEGPGGISIEILREATARAGMQAKFTELPWKRCLKMVRLGEMDAVVDAAERPEYLQGPTSFSVYTNTFWVREEFPSEEFHPAAMKGKTVGLVEGYVYPDKLWNDMSAVGARFDYSVDDGTNIRKLAFGRVDAIVGDYVSTLTFVRNNGLRLKPLRPTHSADRLYPSFNKKRGALHANIDGTLAAMVADGTVDRIYRRYLGRDFAEILPD